MFALLPFCGCNSDTTENPDVPREFIGIFKYTGSTYSPVRSTAPFRYALYDINGGFISYLDTTRLVSPSFSSCFEKLVVVDRTMMKLDGESVLRVKSIKFQR